MVIIRQAILGALCGALTALGVATAVIAFSSSAAEAKSCEGKHRNPDFALYCKTRNSLPAKRKVNGTVDKFNHPRITKRH
jgi:hypothetical protein